MRLNAPFALWTEKKRVDGALGRWLVRLRDLVTRNASQVGQIERIVEVLRQVENVASPKNAASGRCPGTQYVADPFHGHDVHNLLRTVDLGAFVGSSGTLSVAGIASFMKQSGTDGPPALSKDQIESLTLIVQYLKTYGGESIGQDPASASSLPEFWRMAFTERNLRFLPCSDDAGRVLSVNVMLNEWLEHIRLSSLYSSPAWQRTSGQLARNENLSDDDKRKLAMWLYSSILTVEEFADTSIWMCYANLVLLAELAVQIPYSWFTFNFTTALLSLGIQYRTVIESGGGKNLSEEWKRIGTCSTTLLAAYVRKADKPDGLVSEVLDFLASLGNRSEMIKDQPEMVLPIVESLCSTAGRGSGSGEDKTVKKLVQILQTSRSHGSLIATEAGAAALAHFLVSSSSVEAVDKLCRGLITAASTGPDVTLDEGIRLSQLFQVALFSRLGQASSSTQKTGILSRVLQSLRLQRPVVVPNPAADSIIRSVEGSTGSGDGTREAVARTYAATGLFWASVAHSNSHPGDLAAANVRRTSESLAWDTIAVVAAQRVERGIVLAAREFSGHAVLYCSNQCLAAAPTFGIQIADSNDDLPAVLQICLSTILEDVDALSLGDSFFRDLQDEYRDMQKTDGKGVSFVGSETHRVLDRKAGKGGRPFFYAEMGRISRSIGFLMARSWASGQYESVLKNAKRLHEFVTRLAAGWAECPFSRVDFQGAAAYSDTATLFWEYFKMVLFSVVSITRTLVVEEIASPRRAASASESAIAADEITADIFLNVLETFRDLHFVASRMGSEGFGPWREVIVDIADWFGDRAIEAFRQGRDSLPWGIDHAARTLLSGIKTTADNPVAKSQELFCLLFVRQTFPVLGEPFVAADIMPRIDRHTRIDSHASGVPTEDVELFEVSHGIAAQLFDNAGRFRSTAESFAPKYVSLLFDGYPETIDLDLVRRSFSSVVRGLSFGAGSASASDDADITQADQGSPEDAIALADRERADQAAGETDMEDADAVRHCMDRLYDEIESRTNILREAKEKASEPTDWTEARRRDAEFLMQIIEAVRNGATTGGDGTDAWARFLKLPKGDLTRVAAERGQLMVILIDQIRSVSLELLPELLDAIREELLLTDQIERGDSPLWRFAFNAISSSRAFDATKKRYCVDWYLALTRERRAQARELELRSTEDEKQAPAEPLPTARL